MGYLQTLIAVGSVSFDVLYTVISQSELAKRELQQALTVSLIQGYSQAGAEGAVASFLFLQFDDLIEYTLSLPWPWTPLEERETT